MANHRAPAPAGFAPVELPSRYAKALVAILTAALGVLVTALTDNRVTPVELTNLAIAVLTAAAVYLVPNLPAGPGAWAKAIVAVAGTALQALAPLLLEGHVTPAGWVIVALAALGALGVGIVPNTPAPLTADGTHVITDPRAVPAPFTLPNHTLHELWDQVVRAREITTDTLRVDGSISAEKLRPRPDDPEVPGAVRDV